MSSIVARFTAGSGYSDEEPAPAVPPRDGGRHGDGHGRTKRPGNSSIQGLFYSTFFMQFWAKFSPHSQWQKVCLIPFSDKRFSVGKFIPKGLGSLRPKNLQ